MDKAKFTKWICQKRKCANSSGNTVWYNVRRAKKMAGKSDSLDSDGSWITNKVIEKVHTLPRNSARNQLISLLTYMRHASKVKPKVLQRVEADLKQKSAEVDSFYSSQQKTAKQEENWVDYDKILEFHKKLRQQVRSTGFDNASRKQLQKYLMLSLHGPMMPPARLEHRTLVIGTPGKMNDITKNYLHRKNRKWVITINQSKISSRKGSQVLDNLPKAMNALLNRYVKRFKLKPGDPLFVNIRGDQMSKNAYAKRFRNMMWHEFSRNVGVSLMRNIFLSSKYSKIPALKDINDTSQMMLHSAKTALTKYVKH